MGRPSFDRGETSTKPVTACYITTCLTRHAGHPAVSSILPWYFGEIHVICSAGQNPAEHNKYWYAIDFQNIGSSAIDVVGPPLRGMRAGGATT
jgi:hypothetical protein